MKSAFSIVSALLAFAIAAFCVFGFLATFEPTDDPAEFMIFRVGYAGVGFGCLVAGTLLIVKLIRRGDSR